MTVHTVAGFAAHLMHLSHTLPARMQHALAQAAILVRDEARAEIGHYQGAAGPFRSWAPLAEATKRDRVRKGYKEDEPLLRRGDLRNSIGWRVLDRHSVQIGSDSRIAVWQELGTRKIPPRSFLGGAAARKEREVVQILGQQFHAHLSGAATTIPIR